MITTFGCNSKETGLDDELLAKKSSSGYFKWTDWVYWFESKYRTWEYTVSLYKNINSKNKLLLTKKFTSKLLVRVFLINFMKKINFEEQESLIKKDSTSTKEMNLSFESSFSELLEETNLKKSKEMTADEYLEKINNGGEFVKSEFVSAINSLDYYDSLTSKQKKDINLWDSGELSYLYKILHNISLRRNNNSKIENKIFEILLTNPTLKFYDLGWMKADIFKVIFDKNLPIFYLESVLKHPNCPKKITNSDVFQYIIYSYNLKDNKNKEPIKFLYLQYILEQKLFPITNPNNLPIRSDIVTLASDQPNFFKKYKDFVEAYCNKKAN